MKLEIEDKRRPIKNGVKVIDKHWYTGEGGEDTNQSGTNIVAYYDGSEYAFVVFSRDHLREVCVWKSDDFKDMYKLTEDITLKVLLKLTIL